MRKLETVSGPGPGETRRRINLRSPALADCRLKAIQASYMPQRIRDKYNIVVVGDKVRLVPKIAAMRNVGGDGI